MVDISNLELTNEPIDLGDIDNWEENTAFIPTLPPAGTYEARVAQIREVRPFQALGQAHVELVVDFIIDGGEWDGRQVNFQRLNTFVSDRTKSSQILGLFKSAGVEEARLRRLTQASIVEIAEELVEEEALVKFYLNWEAFSGPAYSKLLMDATGADDADQAKAAATPEQKKDAVKQARIARKYRDFPEDPAGGRKPFITCPITGEEVEARPVVTRFQLLD